MPSTKGIQPNKWLGDAWPVAARRIWRPAPGLDKWPASPIEQATKKITAARAAVLARIEEAGRLQQRLKETLDAIERNKQELAARADESRKARLAAALDEDSAEDDSALHPEGWKRLRGEARNQVYRIRKGASFAPLRQDDAGRGCSVADIKLWCEGERADWRRNRDGSYDSLSEYPSLEMAMVSADSVPGNAMVAFRIMQVTPTRVTNNGKNMALRSYMVDKAGKPLFLDTSTYCRPDQTAMVLGQLNWGKMAKDVAVGLIVYWPV